MKTGILRLSDGWQGHAHEYGGGQISGRHGQFIDGGTAAGQKAGFFKKVGGGVAANGQLREDNQPRALG